jgi:hypothetical protein
LKPLRCSNSACSERSADLHIHLYTIQSRNTPECINTLGLHVQDTQHTQKQQATHTRVDSTYLAMCTRELFVSGSTISLLVHVTKSSSVRMSEPVRTLSHSMSSTVLPSYIQEASVLARALPVHVCKYINRVYTHECMYVIYIYVCVAEPQW